MKQKLIGNTIVEWGWIVLPLGDIITAFHEVYYKVVKWNMKIVIFQISITKS
jgi:hypothetical protein